MALAVLVLSACGGAASPLSAPVPDAVSPGYTRIAFEVAGPLNFAKYQYGVVFNTTGNGLTPEGPSNTGGSGLEAYSYALEVGGSGGGTVGAWEYQRSPNCPTCVPVAVQLLTAPSQLQYLPNSNGTEFTILLQRSTFTNTSATWLFNALTTRAKTGAFVDSMGSCATCFVSPSLPVGEAFQQAIAAKPSSAVSDPSARIVNVTISNDP